MSEMEKTAFFDELKKQATVGKLIGTGLTIGFPLLSGFDAAKSVRRPMWQAAKKMPQSFNPLGMDLLPY